MANLKLTTTQWLICIIAAIGFAFDIYELLMLPLILKPVISALSGPLVDQLVTGGMPKPEAMASFAPGGDNYTSWARVLFFVPALVGGIFGLLGGYLTDRLGRRRVLTWSILLYAFSAMAAGFSTSLTMLLFFRCLVFIGVCVEFVAAVAWLAELFPDHERREKILGITQAFSSLGGLLVGLVYYFIAAKWAASLPEIHGGHEAWRYALISGVIPALPLILIRPFLPESPAWLSKRQAGTLSRPSIGQLFAPELARTTIVTTLMFAASYCIAFGAIQQLPQVLSGHVTIKAAGEAEAKKLTDSSTEKVPEPKLKQAAGNGRDKAVAEVTIWQELGGLAGRLVFAFVAVGFVSCRSQLRMFQIPALFLVPLLFVWISRSLGNADSLLWIKLGIFAAGFFTVSQFSFWGNYIPRVFPLHLRGTGESFAANIGGRILGTSAAWLTLSFSTAKPPDPAKIAYVGAIVAGAFCLVGVILSFWLREPGRQSLDQQE